MLVTYDLFVTWNTSHRESWDENSARQDKKNISKTLLPNTQVKSSCQDFKSYSSIQFLVPHRWLFVGSTHYSWRDPPLLLDSWAFWAPKSEETVVSDLKALGWDPNSCPQKVWNVPPSLRLSYYLGAFKNRSTRLSMHMSSSAFANWPCSKGGSFMTWHDAPVSCEWISCSPSFRKKDQKRMERILWIIAMESRRNWWWHESIHGISKNLAFQRSTNAAKSRRCGHTERYQKEIKLIDVRKTKHWQERKASGEVRRISRRKTVQLQQLVN